MLTPKHLKYRVWKCFGLYTVDGEVAHKDKSVWQFCKRPIFYSTMPTNLQTRKLSRSPNEAAGASQMSGMAAGNMVNKREPHWAVQLAVQ